MSLDKILETAAHNAPLVAMLLAAYWFATPRIIKSTLNNGGGEVVKRIVRECNAEQSKETERVFSSVRERLAVVESKLETPRKKVRK